MSLKKLGRYDIIRPLGQGSMGLVFEAHDPNLDRRVAIKTIRVADFSVAAASEHELRFRAEARAGGRLQHPNIVGVYDAGRDQGMAFMVMELVRGGDLRQLLEGDAPGSASSRLPLDRSCEIMTELLTALAFAHEQNIVHRDVKPSNVMLDAAGRVKLGDFGVARITDSAEASGTRGSVVGTLKYMSPEQAQGLDVDSRTDLFAAGVVLYQMLTGIRPFEGPSDFRIMQAIVEHEPEPPSALAPGLPAAIDRVVAKALSKRRELRHDSAREFLRELQATARRPAGHGLPRRAVVAASLLMAGVAAGAGYRMLPEPLPTNAAASVVAGNTQATTAVAAGVAPTVAATFAADGTETGIGRSSSTATVEVPWAAPTRNAPSVSPTTNLASDETAPRPSLEAISNPPRRRVDALAEVSDSRSAPAAPAVPAALLDGGRGLTTPTALRTAAHRAVGREYPAALPGAAVIGRLIDCRARQREAVATGGPARTRGACR